MNINEYRAAFTAYNSALTLVRYRQHVGAKSEIRIDQLRADYLDIFSRVAITDLQSRLQEARAEAETETAGLRGLLNVARLEYVEMQASEVSRELANCEASMHVEWNGETIALEGPSFHLANETTRARRAELVQRWSDALAPCEDLRVTRLQQLHEAAGTIGFDSYNDLIAEATRTDLSQLQRDAKSLLQDTEAVHRLALTRVVAGESTLAAEGELTFADLAYLERLPWLDKFFATKSWSQIYSGMMSHLGIRVDKQPNVQIVLAKPVLGALPSNCFPVRAPDDVRVAFSQRPAIADFACSLHVAGLAQQHAWCSKILANQHPEFIYSADSATGEGYGYLFSFLLLDPTWIQEFLAPISEAQASELVRDVAAVLALRVRRLAAETLYATMLHAAVSLSTEQLKSPFVDLHTRATGFRFKHELFLLNLHERISSAAQLRALAFAAGLREYLRGRYGNRWWAARKAGDELIDLWNTASRYSVAELAQLNGFELNFEMITELLTSNSKGGRK